MYSQQGQGERAKPCSQCQQHGVQTLIQWRPNPDKVGQINQKTGRVFMKPWDVNANDWHQCQFYNPPTTTQTTTVQSLRPPFTPNDRTGESILKELQTLVKQNEQILEYLEVMAADKIKTGIKPAAEISQREPLPQPEYQNNTAYEEEPPKW